MKVQLCNGDLIEGVKKVEQKWGQFYIIFRTNGIRPVNVPLDAILLVDE